MTDHSISVFDQAACLRAHQSEDTIHFSLIFPDRTAVQSLFVCNVQNEITEADQGKLTELLLSNYKPAGSMRLLYSFSNFVVALVKGTSHLFRSVLGGVLGIGGAGFLLVVMLGAAILMVSIFAFLVTLPFLAVSFLVQRRASKAVSLEVEKLYQQVNQIYLSNYRTNKLSGVSE